MADDKGHAAVIRPGARSDAERDTTDQKDLGTPALIEYRSEAFSGPLPHPATLEAYERLHPGATKEIFSSWTDESEHRRQLEKNEQRWFYGSERRGQILAAVVALAVFGGSSFLILKGHGAAGLATIIAEITALATVFVVGKFVRPGAVSKDKSNSSE